VLVWPSAVVPIGGDARVEPAKILRDLGAAVEHVMAPVAALTETFERPAWVDKVRKDPTALRDKLGGKETTKRPSVTRLQRRGKRLHPTGSRMRPEPDRDEGVPAPVVVLPVGIGGADLEPVLDIGGGAAGNDVGDVPVEERSDWNRRLGTLALSGAAAVSALVLALALGGGRIPATVISGGGQVPVGVPGIVQAGQGILGPFGTGTLGATTPPRSTNPLDPTREDQRPEKTQASAADSLVPTDPAARRGRRPSTIPAWTTGMVAVVATAAAATAAVATAAAGTTAAARTAATATASRRATPLERAQSTTRTADPRVKRETRRLTGRVSGLGRHRSTTRTDTRTSTDAPGGS